MLIATVLLALNIDLREVLGASIRAFHGQRCGIAVDIGNGYRHGVCHSKADFHSSATVGARVSSPALPVNKGWHDAGDYGRYVTNSGIATGTLLMAAELYDLDILDEIRWNLDWMLSMQDEDGGVWHKQTPLEFPPFIMPEDDPSTSLVIGKGSCATANLVAVAAIAARIDDPKYLDAARRGWQWLQANPNITFKNPPDVKTGEYGDADCSDETLWAAAELWRASKDANVRAYIDAHVAKAAIVDPPSWKNVTPLAIASLAFAGDARARASTIAVADEIVERAAKHRWRIPMRDRDYVWGSNAVLANYGVQLLIANELKPDRRYVDAAREIIEYLLGENPMSMSFVTGFGERRPMHPHHRPSIADGIEEPWPGLLVGGPNRNRQDPAMAKIASSVPPAQMYIDDRESYATNEIAINWNAPLVFLLAGMLDATTKARVAVYRVDGFPTADAHAIPSATLDEALAGLGAESIATLANLSSFGTLVLPYGSAFPLAEWPHIRSFVARGGNLVVLGGAPFHQPVLADGTLATRQPTWAHELLIGPVDEISVPAGATVREADFEDATKVYALTLRLARQTDMPGEHGSEGPREAIVRPLVQVVHGGLPIATPLIEIDRIGGPEKGGRWIFAPSDARLSAKTIRTIVQRAMRGASHIEARPVLATIDAGDVPRIVVSRAATLVVRDDRRREVHRQSASEGTNDVRVRRRLTPGLYHVEVSSDDDLVTT
ncbi:MAG TPA: glycoside hydrolase family 9 protein, partial [Thermoanaerobaculia bacterium]